jgi:hypothetical protein
MWPGRLLGGVISATQQRIASAVIMNSGADINQPRSVYGVIVEMTDCGAEVEERFYWFGRRHREKIS